MADMRLPLVPSLTVGVAVPALLALGFWQLDRRHEKAAALAAFARPERGTFNCLSVDGPATPRGGRSTDGRTGYSYIATCRLPDGAPASVNLGWSARPMPPPALATPRALSGILYRIPDQGRLLVVTAPPVPLLPSAPPDIAEIPNNHLAYAVQWFAFAAILPVIYGLWLRRWRRERT